jgi:hypothetical protein
MVRVRRLLVPIIVLAVAIVPAAPAPASTQDANATHAVIAAWYALARASVAAIPVAQAKIQSYNRRLAAECPKAGAGTQENEASEPMSKEVAVALWSIEYGTTVAPAKTFAKAIKPLHWTSARFERAVHSFAANLIALATIKLPDLCSDVHAWTAGGFTTVPQDVLEVDERVEPLHLSPIPWGLVAAYVRGHDSTLLTYIKRAETKTAEAEFMLGQKDWYEVNETLALGP